MKFDYIIGNPPYQGENHQQIYPAIFQSAKTVGKCVELIFPTGWQQPKDANNLRVLNNVAVKEDRQIVFIDNRHNVFPPQVTGAEWTNIVLWKRGYDNGLDGNQLVLTDGCTPMILHLDYDKSQLSKPKPIVDLFECVKSYGGFVSAAEITSALKPYGLRTDVIVDKNGVLGTEKYGLAPLQFTKLKSDDIKIYCKGNIIRYVPCTYSFPKTSNAMKAYKVFVPYAWGNMSEKTGLGGAFSNIIVAGPNEVCTESYLESGNFVNRDLAVKHAKYLMTKFCRALLYLNKYSQHSTSAWGAVPIQDYHENFWDGTIEDIDVALMDKYNVPSDIIAFVFSNIQTKTEDNIVNL